MKILLLQFILGFLYLDVQGKDQNGAIWMASPHHEKGRGGKTIKWLVLHGTAGGSSAANIGAWFQNPKAEASTHYIVGQDGHIVQSVREADTAWANGRVESGADSWWSQGNPNYVTISIEHVKSKTDNSNELTPAQKTASFNLIKDILQRHPTIPKQRANANGGITGHYSISPLSRKNCPGPYPWPELFKFLGGAGGGRSTSECFGTVNAKDGLRIRNQPNASSKILGALSNGQRTKLVERVSGQNIEGNSNWFKKEGGGYISAKFVTVSGAPNWCQ